MRKHLPALRKSAHYASLLAWRTRAFWLRAFVCFLVGAALLVLDEAENYDLRFQIRGARTPDPRVVIIDLPERDWTALHDSATRNLIRPLKEIMTFSDSFFWTPELWQRLLKTLLAQDPKAVGIALYFGDAMQPSTMTHEQRVLFTDPRLVWGADLDAAGRALVPDLATTYGATAAIKNVREDDDGIVRRFSSSLVRIPGMPLQLARLATRSDSRLGAGENRWESPQLINFMGPAETFVTLNVRDVLEGRVPLELLRDKVILIGSSSNPSDQMQTPLGRMSRTEILANITDNVLVGKAIRRAPDFVYLIGLFALMLFSVLLLSNYPQTVALIFFVWAGTLIAAISAWTFDSYYVWLPVLSPLLQLGFTYIIFLSYQLSQNEQKTWRLEQERRYLLEIEQLKNNFVSMMSHDLKTPIAKIQGIVDRLLLSAPADIAFDLRSLRRSSDDLHRYIQSILQVTRVEAKDFQISKDVLDINEQIEKVIIRLAPLAQEKRILLRQNLEPMFSIEADPTLIQEVILNLIENAIKYTPPEGSVTITSQEKDDNIYVIVEDTGVGIAPEDQERVWGKFTRGRNLEFDAKGTGLGLYLVKYFVELHGGRVFLESAPGAGTKIGFSIPVASDSIENRIESQTVTPNRGAIL
ncbi:MAG: CHASE2 and HATPase_c domain-containing protein [Bdellovibrionaceae bacterium]|nr:CHASE2 and HATPase_c domain-containing protein [Pseudobdellovibrionaceae bacterium]